MRKLKLRIFQFGRLLVFPKSQNKDLARRELVLNILLCGSLFLTFIATIASWIDTFLQKKFFREESITVSIIFLIFFVMYLFSRAGKARLISYLFISLYLLVTIYSSYIWGADFSQGIIIYALIIVMSGILINSRTAFIISLLISFAMIVLIHLQSTGTISIDSSWRAKPADVGDGIVLSVTLALISLVSWLFNKEMENALQRARTSERELKKQRDLLETNVEERTRELKRVQLERVTQLYRFAEIGQLTSGFMHDLANPISLISLNLHKLNRENQQKRLAHINTLLKRALKGTRYLENFVLTTRKQLQNQEVQKAFSLNHEIKHIIQILSHKANKMHVKIIFEPKEITKTFGNPMKFSQIAMNLILNAIDAYDEVQKNNRIVKISIDDTEKHISLSVQDFGIGIPKENLKKIFDPFFTTKTDKRGTGIGLSITKDLVKKTFHGSITVKSGEKTGTLFTVKFSRKHPTIKQAHEKGS